MIDASLGCRGYGLLHCCMEVDWKVIHESQWGRQTEGTKTQNSKQVTTEKWTFGKIFVHSVQHFWLLMDGDNIFGMLWICSKGLIS